MYYEDHAQPHFHAYYDEFVIVININDGNVLEGKFPRRQLKLLMEWYKIHRGELMENWQLASEGKTFKSIEA